jgi:hypothetical protein
MAVEFGVVFEMGWYLGVVASDPTRAQQEVNPQEGSGES